MSTESEVSDFGVSKTVLEICLQLSVDWSFGDIRWWSPEPADNLQHQVAMIGRREPSPGGHPRAPEVHTPGSAIGGSACTNCRTTRP